MKQANENPDLTTALLDPASSQGRAISIDAEESKSILRAAEMVQQSLQREAGLFQGKIDRKKLLNRINFAKLVKRPAISFTELLLLLVVVVGLSMLFKNKIMEVVGGKLSDLARDVGAYNGQ
jgi:hypothetical protein